MGGSEESCQGNQTLLNFLGRSKVIAFNVVTIFCPIYFLCLLNPELGGQSHPSSNSSVLMRFFCVTPVFLFWPDCQEALLLSPQLSNSVWLLSPYWAWPWCHDVGMALSYPILILLLWNCHEPFRNLPFPRLCFSMANLYTLLCRLWSFWGA